MCQRLVPSRSRAGPTLVLRLMLDDVGYMMLCRNGKGCLDYTYIPSMTRDGSGNTAVSHYAFRHFKQMWSWDVHCWSLSAILAWNKAFCPCKVRIPRTKIGISGRRIRHARGYSPLQTNEHDYLLNS